MDIGLHINTVGTQDSFVMKPIDQHSKSGDDIMTRRLKNRERQRRYRARKRLEADMKKSSNITESTTLQVNPQLNGNLNDCITRVHCKRNWKKDARRAHALKDQADVPSVCLIPANALNNENQMQMLSGIKLEPLMERKIPSDNSHTLPTCETHKTVRGRRDWKADARNKKN